jgi:phenylalanine-4-hydroxylase
MIQQYELYTPEHQWVWQQLFGRQVENLQGKATALHCNSVTLLKDVFDADTIPYLDKLSATLHQQTGWKIHIVKGFIPAVDFLTLLSNKEFAASTWLRKPEELDYLEEPDMFHDVFGHLPILCDQAYASFVHKVGTLGLKYSASTDCIDLIERFYWYTIEFGLVKEEDATKIFGAGIISSFGESKRIFEDPAAIIKPFNLEEVLYLPFDKSSIQPVYYLAESFEQLYEMLPILEAILEKAYHKELAEKAVEQ